MADGLTLVQANLHFLEQGIDLLGRIDDDMYVNTDSLHYDSGVGKHFRHVLDHYLSFVEAEGDKIDYDARERDERIENDRTYAISLAERTAAKLRNLSDDRSLTEKRVRVKSNEWSATNDSAWCGSTFKRELQFLISHTVHHYALIAVILRIQGFKPDDEFGVAPSTLQYQREQISNASG